jgi:hypothetical protein
MKSPRWPYFFLAGLVILGCGGGGTVFDNEPPPPTTATVTGRVMDNNNLPIRDVLVEASTGEQTFTSSEGAFKLENVTVGEIDLKAELVRDGVTWRGSTFVLTFDQEQRSSATIVMAPAGQLGRIRGSVRDNGGDLISNAPVYAYNGAGTSVRAYTDSSGDYEIDDVIGGNTYEVLAMSRGFRGDRTSVQVQAGSTRTVDLVLSDPATPSLAPPQNLQAISWVSPRDATRAPGHGGDPYEAIKQMLHPQRKVGRSLASVHKSQSKAISDFLVETELFWDEQRFDDHLGWGIYFAPSANGSLEGLEYFSDPLASLYFDQGVSPNFTVSYAVTTLSSRYPEFPNVTESSLSNRVVVETLNVLELANPTFGPLTFRWLPGSNADEFAVYLFDGFPESDAVSIWNTEQATTTGTSQVYTGPALQTGHTYYYIVLGLANGDASRTISQIGSFTL